MSAEPIVLIGPGSEWFWSMAQFVVVAVTLIAIYRQISAARSASAVDQVEVVRRQHGSESMVRAELGVLIAIRDGVARGHLASAAAEAEIIGGFWENVGGLARRGHFDAGLLWEGIGGTARIWWAALAPYAHRIRSEWKIDNFWENFEWMSNEMATFGRRAGHPAVDEAWLVSNLETLITLHREFVRFDQAARSPSSRRHA